MSKIDKAKFESADHFEIHEVSIEFGPDSTDSTAPVVEEIQLPKNNVKTLVTVEKTKGEVSIDADASPEVDKPSDFRGGSRIFRIFGPIKSLTLRCWGEAGEIIRATIVVLKQNLNEFPSDLSCLACKNIVGQILKCLLAALGHPHALLLDLPNPFAAVEHLDWIFTGQRAGEPAVKALLEQLNEGLRKALGSAVSEALSMITSLSGTITEQVREFAGIVLSPIGFIAGRVCQSLGACRS
jgi:hypothetical protein